MCSAAAPAETICSTSGIFSLGSHDVKAARVRAMCEAMHHRGPDESGLVEKPGVALGIARLSIIDVAGGHQPLTNEAGEVNMSNSFKFSRSILLLTDLSSFLGEAPRKWEQKIHWLSPAL